MLLHFEFELSVLNHHTLVLEILKASAIFHHTLLNPICLGEVRSHPLFTQRIFYFKFLISIEYRVVGIADGWLLR